MGNNDKQFSLTVLGTRGSMAVSGDDTAKYGHATSCSLVETETEAIILDAGNGILNAPDTGDKKISLLISHTHIDHVLGLPMFLGKSRGKEISVYGVTREGLTIKQQIEIYLKRPLWPITMDYYPVKLEFCGISEEARFHLGPVEVTAIESNHPGGSTIFALRHDGKRIIYATDFEHDDRDDRVFSKLVTFSEGADLVLYDAQYSPEQYQKCRSFGHSTYEKALELYEKAHIKEMMLIHHAPFNTDEMIDSMAKELSEISEAAKAGHIRFAKEGDIWKA